MKLVFSGSSRTFLSEIGTLSPLFVLWVDWAQLGSPHLGSHVAIIKWRLGQESAEDSAGLNVHTSSLTWQALDAGCWIGCLHVASPCTLGFSQHGIWILSRNIPRVSVLTERSSHKWEGFSWPSFRSHKMSLPLYFLGYRTCSGWGGKLHKGVNAKRHG